MEEARAHLSNSWDLEVWAAATLQMHLSLRLEWRQVLCRIRSALTGLDQLSASWTVPLTKLCKLCQIDCQPPSLQYHCCSCKSWYGGKADVWTMRMIFCRRAALHCRSDDSCFYLLAHIPHCLWCTAVALLCRIQPLARMQLQGFRCDQHWHLPPHAPVEPYFLSLSTGLRCIGSDTTELSGPRVVLISVGENQSKIVGRC